MRALGLLALFAGLTAVGIAQQAAAPPPPNQPDNMKEATAPTLPILKVFQFPSGQVPRIDGKDDDWAMVPESYAVTGAGERFEPSAWRTKFWPISHIGPGNFRHSVRTSSSAATKRLTSFSPMISGGRIFITSIA